MCSINLTAVYAVKFAEEPDYSGKYLPFVDVYRGTWYYEDVGIAYEFGIMNGKDDHTFSPNTDITLAEAAKTAASLFAFQMHQDDVKPDPKSKHWYDPYVAYLVREGVLERADYFDWKKTATRAEVAYLLSRANPEKYYPNSDVPLTDIPDVDINTKFHGEILDMYRSGIAIGSQGTYEFNPNSNIKRSEMAAMVARIVCPDRRIELPKG